MGRLVEPRRVKPTSPISPLEDNVLLRVILDDGNQKTLGGIILPNVQGHLLKAEVIAVGPGRLLERGRREPSRLEAGDIVLIWPHAGMDITIDGITFRMQQERDIPGKINEKM